MPFVLFPHTVRKGFSVAKKTCKLVSDRACPMLPSIIAEFIMWLKYTAIIAGCIFLIAVITIIIIRTIMTTLKRRYKNQ
jgi:hypothetical protein